MAPVVITTGPAGPDLQANGSRCDHNGTRLAGAPGGRLPLYYKGGHLGRAPAKLVQLFSQSK